MVSASQLAYALAVLSLFCLRCQCNDKENDWKSWGGGGVTLFGGKCPKPHQPPESQVAVGIVQGKLALSYTCPSAGTSLYGPEHLLCNEVSQQWDKDNATWGDWGGQWPVCAVCPYGWLGFQNQCYKLIVATRNTWQGAQDFCQTMNSSLAEIPNQKVDKFLRVLTDPSTAGRPYVQTMAGNIVKWHAAERGSWVGLSDVERPPGVLTWVRSNRTLAQTNYAGIMSFNPGDIDLTVTHCLLHNWALKNCTLTYSSFICQKDGHVTCGDPGHPANGMRLLSNHGQRLQFKCSYGYKMSGPEVYDCRTTDAVWSSGGMALLASNTNCEEIRCPAPNITGHGISMSSVCLRGRDDYAVDTRLSYECVSGLYMPDETAPGANNVSCLDTGVWSDSVFKCRKVKCPMPDHNHHHVEHPLPHRTYHRNDTLTFNCRVGYHIANESRNENQMIMCMDNNTWSGPVIKCKKCPCKTEHTNASVCNVYTGECFCDSRRRTKGAGCDLCEEKTYRDNTSSPCLPCNCAKSGVVALPNSTLPDEFCDATTGQCDCVCGCTGRDCSVCNRECPAEANYTRELTARGTLDWKSAAIGQNVSASCEYGGIATRVCGCNHTAASAIWLAPNIKCKTDPDPNAALNALLNVVVTEDNAAEISGAMSDITEDETKIEANTLDLSGKVVAKVVDVKTANKKVGEGLVGTVSNLGNVNTTVLKKGNTASNSSNRMLVLAETYASTTLLLSNETRQIESDGFNLKILDLPDITRLTSLTVDAESAPRAGRSRRTADTQPAKASISFENVTNVRHNESEPLRVTFSIFKSSAFFERDLPATTATESPLATEPKVDGTNITMKKHRVNSVVAASKLGDQNTEFDGEVRLDFTLENNGTRPVCVFWDFSLHDGQGGWSGKGCRTVYAGNESSLMTVDDTVQCHCSHLTHFAVLMDLDPTRQAESAHLTALSWITYIGCGVSMLALLIAIFLLLKYKRLRQPVQMRLLLQLCFAWFLTLLTFIIGGRVTRYDGACTAMAVLTHYFLLVVFAFTFTQAYYLYTSLVNVYGKLPAKFFLKCIVFSWGVPALIVVVTMAATVMDAYDPADAGKVVCLINYAQAKIAFIVTLYVPIGLVLIANIIIFILVLRRVIKPRPGMDKRDIEDHKRDLKLSVSLALLLGLTWLFGMALAGEVKLVFEYVFTILNAFLGTCVVLLHFGLRQEVRDELSKSWKDTQTSRSLSQNRSHKSNSSLWTMSKTSSHDRKHGKLKSMGGSYTSKTSSTHSFFGNGQNRQDVSHAAASDVSQAHHPVSMAAVDEAQMTVNTASPQRKATESNTVDDHPPPYSAKDSKTETKLPVTPPSPDSPPHPSSDDGHVKEADSEPSKPVEAVFEEITESTGSLGPERTHPDAVNDGRLEQVKASGDDQRPGHLGQN